MSQYMINKFKGKYRLLTPLDLETNDFPRDADGNIDDAGVYISCQHDNKIYHYGRDILIAYIPSVGRGRNIKKALNKEKIEFFDYDESDEEVVFKFKTNDIEKVAELMKAKTSGASISPFSTKNLPKSDVKIPMDEIARYKSISQKIDKGDLLLIKNANASFLVNILEKSLKKREKKYDYKNDMRNLKMSRQVKEFIFTKGFWDEYLEYLDKEVDKFYKGE